MDEERAPICPRCGVTMLPGTASPGTGAEDWVCAECEETAEPDE